MRSRSFWWQKPAAPLSQIRTDVLMHETDTNDSFSNFFFSFLKRSCIIPIKTCIAYRSPAGYKRLTHTPGCGVNHYLLRVLSQRMTNLPSLSVTAGLQVNNSKQGWIQKCGQGENEANMSLATSHLGNMEFSPSHLGNKAFTLSYSPVISKSWLYPGFKTWAESTGCLPWSLKKVSLPTCLKTLLNYKVSAQPILQVNVADIHRAALKVHLRQLVFQRSFRV